MDQINKFLFQRQSIANSRDAIAMNKRLAAPVTAAPAMLNLANGVQLPLVADEAGYRLDPAYAQEITPAAPGIDLTPLWRLSDAWLKEPEGERQSPGENRLRWAMAKELRDALTLLDASPKGGSDPWRGIYAPERAPNRDEYGCFYHPDIPSWDDEREESIAPLLKAQGFDLQCVPGDFSDEAMEEGGERYWQEMREWNPEPEGDGWRLVAIYDTEDGPYSMFVKPLAQAGDAEVQP